MPEIVLMSVLLPAPLSPTIAVTWPTGMSRSMAVKARTGPKFLPMSASRSSGWAPSCPLASWAPAWSPAAGAWTCSVSCACAAWSDSGADAELGGLNELVGDDGRAHVGRGDPLRREQHRRHRGAVLRVARRAVHQGARRGLASPQEHGQRHGGLRLQVDRLVDGAALVAGQDVLQPDGARVLA